MDCSFEGLKGVRVTLKKRSRPREEKISRHIPSQPSLSTKGLITFTGRDSLTRFITEIPREKQLEEKLARFVRGELLREFCLEYYLALKNTDNIIL